MKNLKINIENLRIFGFYLLLFMLCCASVLRSNNYDFDLWARLIAGMAVVQTGHVLKYDFLSYTPTHNWYDHEWGSSVIFYLFQSNFGHVGLLLLQIILIFLTMFFIVKAVKLICDNETNYRNILIYFVVLDAFMVTYSSLIRCHSFTFMFFVFELFLLEYVRSTKKYGLLYGLPILFLFWGNMHGGVVSGLGLLVMYSVGQLLDRKPFKHYLIISILSPLMLFINPYGIEYVKFLLKATTMPRPYISEWQPIFLKSNWAYFLSFKFISLFFLIVEFIKVVKGGISYKNLNKTKFILMSATLYISILHIKMMPFFVLVSIIYCYNDIYSLFRKFNFPKWSMPALVYFLIVYSSCMIYFVNIEKMVNFSKYPLLEVNFLRKNNITGNILTNFGYGSFVSYKLYPHNKIYMDGRYEEVYYDYELEELKDFYTVRNDPFKILDKYKIKIILLEKNYKIFDILNASVDWKLIYNGANFGIFVRTEDAKNKRYVIPNYELEYYKKTIFNTDVSFKGNKQLGQVKGS